MTDYAKAAVLDHITRSPLPWRTEPMTECGKPQDAVKQVITPEAYRRRVKDLGVQRTSLLVCQTCVSAYTYAYPWTVDPVGVLEREVNRVRHGRAYGQPAGKPGSERAQLADELRAIAALIAAHRDEFDSYVNGLVDTVDLAARRVAKQRRAR